MVITKESLSDLKERFEKSQKLFEEESKLDPIINPYKSTYKAREILIEIAQNLKNLLLSLPENAENDNFIYQCLLGNINKELGRTFIATEEYTQGEKYFLIVLEKLKNYKTTPEAVIPYIESLNNLGLWGIRNDANESKLYLDEAEQLYEEYKTLNTEPLTIYDIFGTKDEIEHGKGNLVFEKNYTLTLYYQAQACTKLDDLHNSAWYCHKTLKRQLEFEDFEPIDWSLNAAVLSQYFFSYNKFSEARHHLSAANSMLDDYENRMFTPDMTEEEKEATRETFRHRYADILRCWAKYGIYILSSSKDRLMTDDDDKNPENKIDLPDITKLKIYSEDLKFESINVENYEKQIIDKFCLTFDEAKIIFHKVHEWLNKSKEYYNPDSEATEHAKIIQDLSSTYNLLAFFEEDGSNQCKLHKRRADLLEEIVKQYNSQYYLKICREVWYELGLTYSKMLDIKLDILNEQPIESRPSPHALNKINLLCDKAVQNFIAFIDSYKAKETDEIPKTLPFDELQAILYCYFHVARIHYKKITPDKMLQIDYISNSLKYYQIFVKMCTENEEAKKAFAAELSVCQEMKDLLPKKLQLLQG